MGGGGGVSASILLRGEGMVIKGGGVAPKKKSPDFRSSEVGISACISFCMNSDLFFLNSFIQQTFNYVTMITVTEKRKGT